MPRTHDDWEKLVTAVLRKEELWQLFHSPSLSSQATDSICSSPPPDFGSSRLGIGTSNANLFEIENVEPGDVFVNGIPLDSRELIMLLSCDNPPTKLTSGHYWYDKYIGFWGKQGHKPAQIITSNMELGGRLDLSASNGNTQVHINGREITKVELRMLKLVGVRCFRDSRFWTFGDGTYQEEGTNILQGNIWGWGKAGVKLIYSLLSLPFPHKASHASTKPPVPVYDMKLERMKLLLIGCSGSGASSIYNQAELLYKDRPFMKDELRYIMFKMRKNIYRFISMLLDARRYFEEENLNDLRRSRSLSGYFDDKEEKSIYSFDPQTIQLSSRLMHIQASWFIDIACSNHLHEYRPLVEQLWHHPAFQQTLKRARESKSLPANAIYFLERAVDIMKANYKPTSMDILYSEYIPSSFPHTDSLFSQPHGDDDSLFHYDTIFDEDQKNLMQKSDFDSLVLLLLSRYQLSMLPIDGSEDNYECLEVFADVKIVIFCVSLIDYDQLLVDGNGSYINKMMRDKEFFESVVMHPSFDQTSVLLLLTDYSLFEKKIKDRPLNKCDWFNDFNPIWTNNGNLGEKAFHYISSKFKCRFGSLTGRKLYAAKVNNLDQDSVDSALQYAVSIIKWNVEYETPNSYEDLWDDDEELWDDDGTEESF